MRGCRQVHETGVMGMSKDAEAYGELERLAFETFEKFEGYGQRFCGRLPSSARERSGVASAS
jgi:hypothetical protein